MPLALPSIATSSCSLISLEVVEACDLADHVCFVAKAVLYSEMSSGEVLGGLFLG